MAKAKVNRGLHLKKAAGTGDRDRERARRELVEITGKE